MAFVAAEELKRPMLLLQLLDDVTAKPSAGTENAPDSFWFLTAARSGFFADGRLNGSTWPAARRRTSARLF